MRDAVVAEHHVRCYNIMVKRIINRVPDKSEAIAEEVVQEAYTRALKFWKGFDPERSKFDTWFNRILNGCVADCIQNEAKSPKPVEGDEEPMEPFMLDEEAWVPTFMVEQVKRGIEQQPDDKREVLWLFFIVGMKTKDIAKCTNYSHDAVRKTIERFRIKWEDENIF